MGTVRDWGLLKVLLETARVGGFRRAEANLGITQPGIGKKIDRLEKMVEAQLLVRTKAGISLTPAGSELFHVAERMEWLVSTGVQSVAWPAARPFDRVRLAVTDGMAGYWLPRHLRCFHHQHPNITLDVRCIDFGADVDLSNREADIAVTYKYPTDLDVVILREAVMELAPMCTTSFIEQWGRPTSISDVRHFPMIAQPFHFHKVGSMQPWAEMLDEHPMIVYRTTSSIVSALMSKMGFGISLQPVGVTDREDRIILLDLDGYGCYLPFYLVCHKNAKDVPMVRAVINYLQNSLFTDDGTGSPSKRTKSSPDNLAPIIAEAEWSSNM